MIYINTTELLCTACLHRTHRKFSLLDLSRAADVFQLVGAGADAIAGARRDGEDERLVDLHLVRFLHLRSRKLQVSTLHM